VQSLRETSKKERTSLCENEQKEFAPNKPGYIQGTAIVEAIINDAIEKRNDILLFLWILEMLLSV
jgi:hypothetical protein